MATVGETVVVAMDLAKYFAWIFTTTLKNFKLVMSATGDAASIVADAKGQDVVTIARELAGSNGCSTETDWFIDRITS